MVTGELAVPAVLEDHLDTASLLDDNTVGNRNLADLVRIVGIQKLFVVVNKKKGPFEPVISKKDSFNFF